MTTAALSSQELFQRAWGTMLADWRQWVMADSDPILSWQARPLPQAIRAVAGRMIDDAEEMLAELRRDPVVAGQQGITARMPVVLTAFEPLPSIPDVSSMRGVPDWMEVQVPSDTQGRTVLMRTIPAAFRAQIAIFANSPYVTSSLATHFCAYLTSEKKRRLSMPVKLGGGLTDDWPLTVLDNSLFPSRVSTEAKNLIIVAVDVVLNGLIPQIAGLGAGTDGTTDLAGRPTINQPVVEADLIDGDSGRHVRWVIDLETGATTLVSFTAPQLLQLENGKVLQLEDGTLLQLLV